MEIDKNNPLVYTFLCNLIVKVYHSSIIEQGSKSFVKILVKGLNNCPKRYEKLFLAMLSLYQGDFPNALKNIDAAIIEHPNLSYGFLIKAYILEMGNESPERIVQNLVRCLSLPNHEFVGSSVYLSLSSVYLNIGRYQRAMQFLKKRNHTFPMKQQVIKLAEYLALSNQPSKANLLLDKYIYMNSNGDPPPDQVNSSISSLGPKEKTYWYEVLELLKTKIVLASKLKLTNQELTDLYHLVTRLNPLDMTLWRCYVRLLLKLKKNKQALSTMQKALGLCQDENSHIVPYDYFLYSMIWLKQKPLETKHLQKAEISIRIAILLSEELPVELLLSESLSSSAQNLVNNNSGNDQTNRDIPLHSNNTRNGDDDNNNNNHNHNTQQQNEGNTRRSNLAETKRQQQEFFRGFLFQLIMTNNQYKYDPKDQLDCREWRKCFREKRNKRFAILQKVYEQQEGKKNDDLYFLIFLELIRFHPKKIEVFLKLGELRGEKRLFWSALRQQSLGKIEGGLDQAMAAYPDWVPCYIFRCFLFMKRLPPPQNERKFNLIMDKKKNRYSDPRENDSSYYDDFNKELTSSVSSTASSSDDDNNNKDEGDEDAERRRNRKSEKKRKYRRRVFHESGRSASPYTFSSPIAMDEAVIVFEKNMKRCIELSKSDPTFNHFLYYLLTSHCIEENKYREGLRYLKEYESKYFYKDTQQQKDDKGNNNNEEEEEEESLLTQHHNRKRKRGRKNHRSFALGILVSRAQIYKKMGLKKRAQWMVMKKIREFSGNDRLFREVEFDDDISKDSNNNNKSKRRVIDDLIRQEFSLRKEKKRKKIAEKKKYYNNHRNRQQQLLQQQNRKKIEEEVEGEEEDEDDDEFHRKKLMEEKREVGGEEEEEEKKDDDDDDDDESEYISSEEEEDDDYLFDDHIIESSDDDDDDESEEEEEMDEDSEDVIVRYGEELFSDNINNNINDQTKKRRIKKKKTKKKKKKKIIRNTEPGNIEESKTPFENDSSLEADFGLLYTLLAEVTTSDDKDKALEYCRIACEYNPSLVTPYRLQARLHTQRGEYREAIAVLSKLIFLKPIPIDFFRRAKVEVRYGDLRGAERDIRIFLASENSNMIEVKNSMDLLDRISRCVKTKINAFRQDKCFIDCVVICEF